MSEINSSGLEYLVSFYNGHRAVAERLESSSSNSLHIGTPLEEKVKQWLNMGKDVVLTGNPGDGKTHLMQIILRNCNPGEIGFEVDASQRTPDQILEAWRAYKRQQKPFLLAINHAPLRHLALEAQNDTDFSFLYDRIFPTRSSLSEIENFTIYSNEQIQTNNLDDFVLIDLGQRELLTDDHVVDGLLDRLCEIAAQANCEDQLPEGCQRCPIRYNAQALREQFIRDNLKRVLALVAQRGFHATMRDLIGFFVYVLTGGKTCETLWTDDHPSHDYYDYYNLLFSENARNNLFDSLKKTFDPGKYADSKVDMSLWTNEVLEGWWRVDEIRYRPSDILALQSRKRRYFFEHTEAVEDKLQRMLSTIERDFDKLIRGLMEKRTAVEMLIERINLLYAPLKQDSDIQGYRSQLRLWNQHRYSVGRTAGYVAMRRISTERLTIYYPMLHPKYENAIQIRKDHVLLAVHKWQPGDPALRIDWEMYQALAAASAGRLIDVQPYHILRRLDLFLRSLGFEVGRAYSEETIEWGDYKNRQLITIRVNREQLRYRE